MQYATCGALVRYFGVALWSAALIACTAKPSSQADADRHIKAMRENTPGAAVRMRASVLDTSYNGVPASWINRERRQNGVIVYIHGGSYVMGPSSNEWMWMRLLSDRTNMAALGIIYRMPPEYPFPAALDDAVAAVVAAIDSRDVPRDRWVLAGASAGGGLAASTVRVLLDRGYAPLGLLLMAPWVDLAMYDSVTVTPDDQAHTTLAWAAHYYAGRTSLADPRISPINSSFTHFPPTYIDVGTRDGFLQQDRLLRDRMRAAGVSVTHIEQEGGDHVYSMLHDRPEAAVSMKKQAEWIVSLLRPRE
jgi:acetyl esterase/lipase